MKIAKDPETGELRLPTPEENQRLEGRRPAASNKDVKTVVLPDGTEMILHDESHMSYAVARKNADGSVTQTCVHGPDAAKAALAPAPAPPPAVPPAEVQ